MIVPEVGDAETLDMSTPWMTLASFGHILNMVEISLHCH